jgi:putative transposase
MLRLLVALLPTLRSAMRSRRDLVVENLALRQQLVTLAARRHPDIRPADRVFWILLRRFWSGWAESLTIVRPDTVVRWHRAGFRIYWNWLSKRGTRSGRPPLPLEVRALIRRMATENSWGAPCIHGELLRLGFDVSERSVSRYLRTLPRTPRANPTWTTFLRNHRDGIAAMDFFSVPTALFRVLHVFLVVRHARRDVVRCAVTACPTAAWVAQQLREAFPFDSAPRFMIFDRDAIFSAGVAATLRSMQVEPTRTSHRSPWQNGLASASSAPCARKCSTTSSC